MFMANVIIGNTIVTQPDKTLKDPPFIRGSTQDRYDSVKGKTEGSDVIMLYSNKKSYPEYLITYKL
jgi:hypothetical protein